MKLLNYRVGAGGQFTPDTSVYIVFEPGKATKLTGDNKTGKTTIVDLLLLNTATLGGDDLIKKLVNKDTGTLEAELEFVGNDRLKYKTRITKSQFILEYEGEKLPEPKEKTRQLLGAVGVNPMAIKNAPLEDVVKWLAAYTTRGVDEYQKEYRRIKDGVKGYKEARATANKQYKALRETIGEEVTEQAWQRNEAKYGKKQDIKALAEKLDDAGKRSDNLIKAETKLKELKTRREQLLAELAEVDEKIKTGETYVEKNKAAKTDYDNIRQEYQSAAVYAAKYEWWQQTKRKKAEMDEYETAAQLADAKEKELLDDLKKLQAEIIPDIRGAEFLLEDEIENGKVVRKEGLYYNGFSLPQTSESEFFELVMKIWKKNKVKIVVIDGFSNLGSAAVDMLNKLKKDGAYILYTEMRRGQDKIEIELE